MVRRAAAYWWRPLTPETYTTPPQPVDTYNEAGHLADVRLMLELLHDHTLSPAVRKLVMKWVLRPGEEPFDYTH